jgi:hypothetical protein
MESINRKSNRFILPYKSDLAFLASWREEILPLGWEKTFVLRMILSPGPPWCRREGFFTCQRLVIMGRKMTGIRYPFRGFLKGKGEFK